MTEPAVDLSDEGLLIEANSVPWSLNGIAALLKRVRDAARAEGAEEMDHYAAEAESLRRQNGYECGLHHKWQERAEKAEAALAEARREADEAEMRWREAFGVAVDMTPMQVADHVLNLKVVKGIEEARREGARELAAARELMTEMLIQSPHSDRDAEQWPGKRPCLCRWCKARAFLARAQAEPAPAPKLPPDPFALAHPFKWGAPVRPHDFIHDGRVAVTGGLCQALVQAGPMSARCSRPYDAHRCVDRGCGRPFSEHREPAPAPPEEGVTHLPLTGGGGHEAADSEPETATAQRRDAASGESVDSSLPGVQARPDPTPVLAAGSPAVHAKVPVLLGRMVATEPAAPALPLGHKFVRQMGSGFADPGSRLRWACVARVKHGDIGCTRDCGRPAEDH